MLRRPVGGGEVTYHLANAPETMTLADMAGTGCLRWTIEEDVELRKGEVGLAHYEVTKLRGGYHHITLSLLALAFMKGVQRRRGEKIRRSQRAGDPAAPGRGPAPRPLGRPHGARLAAPPAPPQGGGDRLPPPALAA